MIRSAVRIAIVLLLAACGSKTTEPTPGSGSAPTGSGAGSSLTLATTYERQCANGDLEACRSLAIMLGEGAGVAQDLPRSTQLFDKACVGGNMIACNHLALALTEGIGVPKDPKKARDAYGVACTGGYGLGCRNLGLMLREGRGGIPADLPAAAVVLAKACTLKAPFGCTNAGDVYAVQADWPKANEHYQKGCEQKEGSACRQLALAYIEGGRGLPKSDAAAAVWLTKGCALEEPVTCRILGASVVQTEPERGRQLLRTACDKNDTVACQLLSDSVR